MIFTANIVSMEHFTFTYLSIYNRTANDTLQLKSGKIEPFRVSVPEEVPNGVTHYAQGNDPTKKLIPARLEDPSKRKQ